MESLDKKINKDFVSVEDCENYRHCFKDELYVLKEMYNNVVLINKAIFVTLIVGFISLVITNLVK